MTEFWTRLARNRLWDVGVGVIAVLGLVRIVRALPGSAVDVDFTHYYVGSRLLLAGQNPFYTSLKPMCDQLGFVFTPYIPIAGYPPPFLWLFAPLALLPPRAAFALWVLVQAGSLAGILWLTRRLLGARLSGRAWWLISALTVASPTIFFHFYFAQVQFLLAVLVLAAYALRRAGQPVAACLTVTAAGLIKFYPFLLLPWFVWRGADDWRGRARLIGMSAVLGMAVVVLTGPGLWWDFFEQGMPMAVAGEINRASRYSVPALVTNLGFASAGFMPVPGAARLWWALGTAAGLAVVALAYGRCAWRSLNGEVEFCLLTVAMLAGTVTVQVHYFVWLVFPVAVAVAGLAQRPCARRGAWLGLCLVLLTYLAVWKTPGLDRHIYWKILLNNLPLAGLLGLGWFFASDPGEATCGNTRD